MLERWRIYQRERFPLALHGPVIAAFALSATTFVLLARQQLRLPGLKPFLAAFVSSLAFFFQLRIADEWKDSAEDARFRAYRPVPRGLISLRELAAAGLHREPLFHRRVPMFADHGAPGSDVEVHHGAGAGSFRSADPHDCPLTRHGIFDDVARRGQVVTFSPRALPRYAGTSPPCGP